MRSHDDIRAELTAPGAPFEMTTAHTANGDVRAWKNAAASLRDMVENSKAFGDAVWLVYEDDELTYAEHYAKVAGLAKALIEDYGVAKGDRVAIAMRNYPEWCIAFFAAASVGAIAVPLNAWWTAPELEFGLTDSGSKVLIADAERADRLAEVLPRIGVPLIVARPDAPLPDGARDIASFDTADSLPDVEIAPEDPATIFYTSGTTGRPKGALGSQRAICGNVMSTLYSAFREGLRDGKTLAEMAAEAANRTEQAKYLVAVPLFHATGCHAVMLTGFHVGAELTLMYKWDAGEALRLIEERRIQSMTGVPTMVAQMLAHPDFPNRDISSMTGLGSGGASAPPVLVERVRAKVPTAAVGNGYGLTETSAVTTTNRGKDYERHPDSVGLAVPICDVEVVDILTGEELPRGEVGELRIRGANVVDGYWNRPDATAETIVDGWLHSGDLARMDEEGFVYIADRAKDMIIRGGENVYPAEVEAALHTHPGVADCAVLGIPDEIMGEEVAAVVKPHPGVELTVEKLTEYLAERIAKFKIPTHVNIQTAELPRNAAGKILKRELKGDFA